MAVVQQHCHADGEAILDYSGIPGTMTHPHHHPAFVLYALAPFERDSHLQDGKVLHRSFKQGDVLWSLGADAHRREHRQGAVACVDRRVEAVGRE